jgi:hypothetical protein
MSDSTPRAAVRMSVVLQGAALVLATAAAIAACGIDFNEAIPCVEDGQCPTGMACDGTSGRCVTGEGTGGDVDRPDVENDLRTRDTGRDIPFDFGNEDTGRDDLDDDTGRIDTGGNDTGTTDTGGTDTGACTPTLEVCNGLDEDCDGVPDNGVDCGTCPDPFGMTLIVRPDVEPYCIDLYESSRPDASASSAGADSSRAVSRSGALPWGNIGLNDARTACNNAGKRLCTVAEWAQGCGGIEGQIYPYSADAYDPDACNGLDAGSGLVGATGSRILCESPDGTLDQSGNLAEWVEGGFVRGGSYGSDQTRLRCDDGGLEPDLSAPGDVVGFRCCANTVE